MDDERILGISAASYPILTPDEAASYIKDGDTVSFSGFSPAGAAKLVPKDSIADPGRGRQGC